MSKITPCLWFNTQAEEAARFYVSIFNNARIKAITPYGEAAAKSSGLPLGSVMTVLFELEGQEFMGLNGGPEFTFSPAISLMVNCKTQAEIDAMWERLVAGGKPSQCGWLTDKYGVSWQIFPTYLGNLLKISEPEKLNRVMQALLPMQKLDLKTLQNAADKP